MDSETGSVQTINLEDTSTISLMSAISANTESIAEIQNNISRVLETISLVQRRTETAHDELCGQVREIHGLLTEINDTNEYYCDRCHDLLIIVAVMTFILLTSFIIIFSSW